MQRDERVIDPLEYFPAGVHEDPATIDAQAAYMRLTREMNQEREAYELQKLELLRSAGGRWTAFVGEKCLGTFGSREAAANIGYGEASRMGRLAVFVTQIGDTAVGCDAETQHLSPQSPRNPK